MGPAARGGEGTARLFRGRGARPWRAAPDPLRRRGRALGLCGRKVEPDHRRRLSRPVRPGDFRDRRSPPPERPRRSEEHTSELQSLMRISYAVFCLKKKNTEKTRSTHDHYSITTDADHEL